MIENVKFKDNTRITFIQIDKMTVAIILYNSWNLRPGCMSFCSVKPYLQTIS